MPTPNLLAPWIPVVTVVSVFLFGTGGLVALIKLFLDSRAGVKSREIEEENSEAARWKSIIETQTAALLKPLQEQVDQHAEEIRKLKEQLRESESKYRRALHYIRLLMAWAIRNLDGPAVSGMPEVPIELSIDL
jgi:Sec-independent protein translocase protein TatA